MDTLPPRNADDLLNRIREMEEQGQLVEALALAREAATTFGTVYDWSAEVTRLEQEGKLARPYREGVEALAEGDTEDAVRLLGWITGKAPRYREAARYLFWAVEGRDPYVVAEPEPEPAPRSLLNEGHSPWGSVSVWVVLLFVAAGAFGAGWHFSPAAAPPAATPVAEAMPEAAPVAAPTPEATPAPTPPAPTPEAAPVATPPAPAPSTPAPAPVAATPAPPATTAKAPRAHPTEAAAPAPAEDLSTTCQSGDAHACFTLGDNDYFGRGTPRDLAGAARAYGHACDLRDARGCYNAGDMADKGEAGARDKAKALTLFSRGCELGDGQSCSRKGFLEVETTDVP